MPEFLLVLAILGGISVAIGFLVAFFGRYSSERTALTFITGGIVVLAAAGGTLGACGSYIAGQGDAPEAARTWTAKFRPGWSVGECQPRDTDNNKYITCTLVPPEAGDDPEPIECGVDRWYHGLGVSGCRQLVFARGASR